MFSKSKYSSLPCTPSGQNPSGQNPSGQNPSGQNPSGQNPSEKRILTDLNAWIRHHLEIPELKNPDDLIPHLNTIERLKAFIGMFPTVAMGWFEQRLIMYDAWSLIDLFLPETSKREFEHNEKRANELINLLVDEFLKTFAKEFFKAWVALENLKRGPDDIYLSLSERYEETLDEATKRYDERLTILLKSEDFGKPCKVGKIKYEIPPDAAPVHVGTQFDMPIEKWLAKHGFRNDLTFGDLCNLLRTLSAKVLTEFAKDLGFTAYHIFADNKVMFPAQALIDLSILLSGKESIDMVLLAKYRRDDLAFMFNELLGLNAWVVVCRDDGSDAEVAKALEDLDAKMKIFDEKAGF